MKRVLTSGCVTQQNFTVFMRCFHVNVGRLGYTTNTVRTAARGFRKVWDTLELCNIRWRHVRASAGGYVVLTVILGVESVVDL